MTAKFKKSLALLLVMGILACSLCGCDTMDYRKAISLYNAGRYDAAAELFAQIGDYEDAPQLATLSHYWAALSKMEAGKFDEALPRFEKLGDYEDAEARVAECQYQLALAAFEDGDLPAAEDIFLEIPDYRQTPEYLRQINWQKLFDAVAAGGAEGIGTETSEGMRLQVISQKEEPNQLTFFVSHAKNTEYAFYDDLALTLIRDSLEAEFIATSSFTMDYLGNKIGSTQTASGKVDISVCTAETVLPVTVYERTTTDNQGNTTTVTDPSEILMADDMAENFAAMLSIIPTLLEASDIPLTLKDIGFYAL